MTTVSRHVRGLFLLGTVSVTNDNKYVCHQLDGQENIFYKLFIQFFPH